ncbi:MAG TPA: pseudouridine synthase [Patescibacteria group bacterium]|nr:pseudouridine synthase [Patescibacteria group bacterium]
MRLNQYVAQATGMSRRAADAVIAEQRVRINGTPAQLGQSVHPDDQVTLDGKPLESPATYRTVLFHKPAGYVCSRNGQGSATIYELLPPVLHELKPVGRLDKDSSGLLLLTNDGQLSHQLTHPRFEKTKLYQIELDKPLSPMDEERIHVDGVKLEDGFSRLTLTSEDAKRLRWRVDMHEGRNRQIRRTFAALGYKVTKLHRTQFGEYVLSDLAPGAFSDIA